MEPDIRMVALDLDGTALAPNGDFSERTRKVFRETVEKGVHIVIATGRSYGSLPKAIFNLEGLEYIIMSNGAKILRLSEEKIIYKDYIKKPTVENLVEIFKREGWMVEAFIRGEAFISSEEFFRIKEGRETMRDREYVLATRKPIDNLFEFMLENGDKIENISVNYHDNTERMRAEKILEKVQGITLTSSFDYNHEMGGNDTSKANALKYLLKSFGLDRENLMACGDSPNDLAMIQLAKIGVAMGNSRYGVEKYADYVTATNSEDGVAKAIEKFIL